jgi:hypothetical protein
MDLTCQPKVYITAENEYIHVMSTVQEIEKAIEALPLAERMRLYKDMPQLIGRDVEDLDWQRLALERFFQDDSPDDHVYDQV